MGGDDNEVTVLTAASNVTLPLAPKRKLARALITIIANEMKQRKQYD
jgi:hypothetical protein